MEPFRPLIHPPFAMTRRYASNPPPQAAQHYPIIQVHPHHRQQLQCHHTRAIHNQITPPSLIVLEVTPLPTSLHRHIRVDIMRRAKAQGLQRLVLPATIPRSHNTAPPANSSTRMALVINGTVIKTKIRPTLGDPTQGVGPLSLLRP